MRPQLPNKNFRRGLSFRRQRTGHNAGGDFSDAADSQEASYTPDIAQELDSLEDQWLEKTRDLDKAAAVSWCAKQSEKAPSCDLSYFIALLLSDTNPLLFLWCLAFAFGLEVTQGLSQNAVAKKLRVTRAAISKRVMQLSLRYGLRSRNMKSVAAQESYRHDRLTNHHRYQDQIQLAKEHHAKLFDG